MKVNFCKTYRLLPRNRPMGCRDAARVLFMFIFTSVSAFKLLDVGAPRTGTQSMFDAMRILGLHPMHSGYELIYRPKLCAYLFGNGTLDDALAIMGGFDSAMDEPVMLMYEEVMAAFPEATFLLTISEPESWFNNYVEIVQMMHNASSNSTPMPDFMEECTAMRSWGCHMINSTEEQKATCLENYDRHNRRVQEVIPPERLLVYNWSDGWAPLAHFLGTAIPEEEFPHDDPVRSHFEKVSGQTSEI